MLTEQEARSCITRLQQTHPHIHVSYHNTYPKVAVINQPATISKVYAHLFEIEYLSDSGRTTKSHSYADVICRRLVIHELES